VVPIPAKLLSCETERDTRSPARSWRTPHPSPTKVPVVVALKLTLPPREDLESEVSTCELSAGGRDSASLSRTPSLSLRNASSSSHSSSQPASTYSESVPTLAKHKHVVPIPAKLLSCETERDTRSPARSWRTPHPSPTKVPVVVALKLTLLPREDLESEVSTCELSAGGCDSASLARTPSPSPRNVWENSFLTWNAFALPMCHSPITQQNGPRIALPSQLPATATATDQPEPPTLCQQTPDTQQNWPVTLPTLTATVTDQPEPGSKVRWNAITGDDDNSAELPAEFWEHWGIPPCVVSLGSAGHPHNCSQKCKYVKKKRGCKDGADCDHCHLCALSDLWKRSEEKHDDKMGQKGPCRGTSGTR